MDAVSTPSRLRHDWRIALALSVVPGLGQLYNGQPLKGLRLLFGTVIALAGSIWMFLELAYHRSALYSDLGLLLLAVSLLAVVVFLAVFIYGLFLWSSALFDAHECARLLARGERAPRRICFFRL